MRKTGFIAILGRPNVGKSTLLNNILGEKIAIVSNKPQTTRTRITGVLTRGETQFVFLDTPGMHRPRTKLGDYMVKSVNSAIGEVDVALLMAEAGTRPGDIEHSIVERIQKKGLKSVLVINKIDTVGKAEIAKSLIEYSSIHDFDAVIPISAITSDGVDIVLDEVQKLLSEEEWYFPEDMLTDQSERQIASEIIREKLLRTLNEEIPHGTAVVIEEFKENSKIIKIRAEIFCEKDSHKGIIIGKNGATLKLIGTRAREDMEAFFDSKVYLDLWVKVKEKWRDSDFILNNFGYNPKNLDQ